MKRLKVVLLVLLAGCILAGDLYAQAVESCTFAEDQRRNAVDTVVIRNTRVRPGDTVWVPFEFQNSDTISGFDMYFEVDTTYLSAVPNTIDPTFVQFDVNLVSEGGRFPEDQTDTASLFQAQFVPDSQTVIRGFFFPQASPAPVIEPGSDTLVLIPLVVDSAAPHNTVIPVRFWSRPVYAVDTIGGLPDSTLVGCQNTEFAKQGGLVPSWPRLVNGTITIDTGLSPVKILAFNTPDTVGPSSSFSAQYIVSSEADSVVLFRNTTRIASRTDTAGAISVVAPSILGTYSYRLVAWAATTSVQSSRNVVVNDGGSVGGDPPTISFNPAGGVYSIEAGQPLTFTVSATDPDGKQVTLSASSLPGGSTFGPTNPVIGTPTASGNFSWTPDISQVGSTTIIFGATDADNDSRTQTAQVVVTQPEVDRLFSTSYPGQAPTGGLRGATEVVFPINLVSTQSDVYGLQFNMSYPHTVVSVDSFVTTGRIPDWVIYDNIGDTPGEILVLTLGLNNEPVVSDTTSAVLYSYMSIDTSGRPWTNYWIYLENGRESVDPNPNVGSLPLDTDSGVVQVDSIGDVNLDWIIDVGDAVSSVGYIIGNYGLTKRQFATADIITNDTVNVFDLVGVINSIFEYPISPIPVTVNPDSPAPIAMDFAPLQAGMSGTVRVETELPEQLAGVQLEFQYDASAVSLGKPQLTDYAKNFTIYYKDDGSKLSVVMYTLGVRDPGQLIDVGYADLVNVPLIARKDVAPADKKVRLTKALLSTSAAEIVKVSGVDEPVLPDDFQLSQNYPNPFNPTTKIDFAIEGTGTKKVMLDVFNILGQNVITLVDDELSAGSYTVTWDATDRTGQRVASGVYLYRLQVSGEARSKKMLFLK